MDEICRTRRFMALAGRVSRRTVARGVLGGALVVSLLDTTSRRAARSQATPTVVVGAVDETGPRRYVLLGEEMAIVYEPAAGGVARLNYRDASASRSFTGDELDLAHNASLGQVATVLLEAVPDAYVRYLTLLVPDVNRDEDRSDVPIRTLAILTRHLTNIGGSALVKGALQTYDVVALEGVVEFAPA